jgi:FkbM family methyltransferase
MKSAVKRLLRRAPRLRRAAKNALCIVRREPLITWKPIGDRELAGLVRKDDPVILDIGCNDGTQTLWFLRQFNEARVYCFEPDPRARERFLQKVKDDRAVLFDIAISDTNGTREFFPSSGVPDACHGATGLPADWDLSGSIRRPKKHLEEVPWCKFDTTILVKTKTLDCWASELGIGRIDLIWADVQGAEGDLIAGGKVALSQTRYFYTECSDSELYEGQINLKQLLKMLPDFRVVRRYEHDVLLRNAWLD